MTLAAEAGTVVWHEVECGSYEADLPLWSELAAAAPGPVLELGSGSGRVALHLARRGHEVVGLDSDPKLVSEMRHRADAEGLRARAEVGDAAGFRLGERFGVVVAPMQLVQLLPGPAERRRCLESVGMHLQPGGRAALAIVEGAEGGAPETPPIPDVRESDGWVYSSLPLGVRVEDGALVVERLRQAVSPEGWLSEARSSDRLAVLDAGLLEEEGRDAGLRPVDRLAIAPTSAHVGSTVVVFEAGEA